MKINWKQPSTQRGIAILGAGLLQMLGHDISFESVQTAVGALMTVAGAIGILRTDPPATPTSTPATAAPPVVDDLWKRDP